MFLLEFWAIPTRLSYMALLRVHCTVVPLYPEPCKNGTPSAWGGILISGFRYFVCVENLNCVAKFGTHDPWPFISFFSYSAHLKFIENTLSSSDDTFAGCWQFPWRADAPILVGVTHQGNQIVWCNGKANFHFPPEPANHHWARALVFLGEERGRGLLTWHCLIRHLHWLD